MARRDPLDTSLIRLCSLAEETTVVLREAVPVRDAFRSFRFDPDALADELTALALRGRAAHTERQHARGIADMAAEEARELAEGAYAAQADFRTRLAAAAVFASDPTEADDLRDTLSRFTLKNARVPGALDVYRRLEDHLARPDHTTRRHDPTASIPAEVSDWADRLEAALIARDDALRTRRIVVKAAEAVWTDLRAALRRIRQMGEVAATRSYATEVLLSYLDRKTVPTPQRGPGASSEGAETRSEGAETRSECAETRSEPAETRSEPAEPRSECAETRSEPAESSNADFDPTSCEP